MAGSIHFVLTPLLLGAAALELFSPAAAHAAGTCTAYDPGSQVGTLSDSPVDESSGLAASILNPGVYWTHNDSGNSADLYAFGPEGALLGKYDLTGASNIDWEDMAVGPCPESCACLFVADMGDNLLIRGTKTIYRVAEPDLAAGGEQTEEAEALTFEYPDGKHDAETLLVDPRSGDIYVVTTESSGVSGVYRFPDPDPVDLPVTLEKVGEITFTGGSLTTTGGSVTADGGRVVVRTYNQALEWDVPEGAPLEAAFASAPRKGALPSSSGGESIAYAVDGMSILTTSEGEPMPVYETPCREGAPVTGPAAGLEAGCEPESTGCGTVAVNRGGPLYGWGVMGGAPLVILWRRRRASRG